VEAGLDPVKALDTTSEESVMNCWAKIQLIKDYNQQIFRSAQDDETTAIHEI
jgi:hypothetical protein